MYILESKHNKKFAIEELKALCKAYQSDILDIYKFTFLINKKLPFERLTQFKVACKTFDISENLGTYRIIGPEKNKLGKILNGKVQMKNPKTVVGSFEYNGKIIFGKKVWKYKMIKEHVKKTTHITMKPKLARFLVNLSCAKEGERLLDPFCGTGSILYQAELFGINTMGIEKEKKLFEMCRQNINGKVFLGNFFERDTKKFESIVADLPYGRGTKKCKNKKEFVKKTINKINQVLKSGGTAVIVADFIIENENVDVLEEYVHKNLTRYIHIFKKK